MYQKEFFINFSKASLFEDIGSTGFEPATSASRTQRSTKLSYDPLLCMSMKFSSLGLTTKDLPMKKSDKVNHFYSKMKKIPEKMEKNSTWSYNIFVKNKSTEPVLEEFKFHYRNSDSVELSDKYFMAHDLDEAVEMFDYACDKRHLDTEVTEVFKWNRWLSKWEKFDIEDYISSHNDLNLHFKFENPKNRINFEH